MSEAPLSAPRSAAAKGALVLFGLALGGALAFLGAETYFRFTSAPFHPDALRANSLEYERSNLARHVFPRRAKTIRNRGPGTQHISERGYRGPSFALEKPDGLVRVAVIGGSAVYDIHADEGEDWPRLSEKRLRERGVAVQVLNFGIPGHASWDGLGRLYGEIWMFEPDYVALSNCWNDLKYFSWLGPDSTLLRTRVTGPASDGDNPYLYPINRLDALLLRSRAYAWLRWRYLHRRIPTGVEGVRPEETELQDSFSPWGPRQYELNLGLFVESARRSGARPLLLTQPRLPVASNAERAGDRISYRYTGLSHDALVRAFDVCDAAVRRVSREEGVPLLDLSELNGRDSLFADHVHFRREGSAAAADRFAAFLESVVTSP